MSDQVRVRFAPSPTGNVHIGNIRAAIFNWLFARHNNGKFLLRVEDTDKERSTSEAVGTLMECMEWLGLDFDEEPFFQSTQEANHIAVAEKLISEGRAYRHAKGDGGEVVLFRMPLEDGVSSIETQDEVSQDLHADVPVKIAYSGISFALISRKGKAVPQEDICLAGFRDLKLYNAEGEVVFELNGEVDSIIAERKIVEIVDAVRMTFTRRTVSFDDMIKGKLSKPLDSVKDLVILKSNGSPLFHLANVCDDITQKMTHIVRGDDHVENTYRHVLLYHALGEAAPVYAHLPMIVNKQGKPYSKRDGDAYVGDFRSNGYLAESLFNYLILLGWSPGDDREKISRAEAIELFDLARCKSTAAQMDMDKLYNINGQYLQELSAEEFLALVNENIDSITAYSPEQEELLVQVSGLMQSRTKLLTQLETWNYFFSEDIELDLEEKQTRKALRKEGVVAGLAKFSEIVSSLEISEENIEAAAVEAAEANGFKGGQLNKPIRLAVTGAGGGADLFPSLMLIGKEKIIKRLESTIALLQAQA